MHYFVDRFARELGKRIEGVSRESMARLRAWHWPGNVRELSNVIERAVVLAQGPVLEIADTVAARPVPAPPTAALAEPHPAARAPAVTGTLAEVERRHLQGVLERTRWRIEGPHGAAHALGLQPSTLRSRMKKLGLRR